MLGLILNSVTKWLRKYKSIAKTSPFYVFGSGTENVVITGDGSLPIPTYNEQMSIFDYKSLVINNNSVCTVGTYVNPVIIRCTDFITINGHLHVNNLNQYIFTNDNQTTCYLGRDILKGVRFNYNNSSVDSQTYNTIRAYAGNNILTNCEVKHAGNAKAIINNTIYPAKGGMVVLYYNTLHNNGSIHASGSTVADNQEFGGGTLILCAPVINIGINGKITADGGTGGGCVASLNSIPEQASDSNSTTLTAYISSIPVLKDKQTTIIEPILSNLEKVAARSDYRKLSPLVPNTNYVFLPNTMPENATLYIDAYNRSQNQTTYITNATVNTFDLKDATYVGLPSMGTIKPVAGYILNYTASTQTWSIQEDNTLAAYVSGITGSGLYKELPTPVYNGLATKILSYEFSLNNAIDVTFSPGSQNTTWTLKCYLSKVKDWIYTDAIYLPSIYASIYRKNNNVLTPICTTNTVQLDNPNSTTSALLNNISITELKKGGFVNPTEVTLSGNLSQLLTVSPTDTILVDLYIQMPELQLPYGQGYAPSNNSLITYVGYYAPTMYDYQKYNKPFAPATTDAWVTKGPYISTITTSQSDISGRGGAGLCIGIKLPKVY